MPFILIIIGLCLIFLNIKAITKEKNDSFDKILSDKEDNISDLEVKIGQVRKDMAESLLDIQKEMLELKNSINSYDNENEKLKIEVSKDNKQFSSTIKKDVEVYDEINRKSKSERVFELIEKGFSDEEICEKLKLGKGEVQLVRGLYKKEKE